MNPNLKSQSVSIFIQARMGATRLFGKPLKTVLNKPLLSYLVERLKNSKTASKIVIATSDLPQDDPIAKLGKQLGVSVFRGSEEDVLDRFYQASKQFPSDVIVRITADCPLLDPRVVDEVVKMYLDHYPAYDYVSNVGVRHLPRGMDVEVFSSKALKEAAEEAHTSWEREHVTPFFYEHPTRYRIGQVIYPKDESHYRWCVDTPEDFALISKILEYIYPNNPQFTLQDLLKLLQRNPEWSAINSHIQQKQRNQ
jgi:spore coat polysaccharide biosynthesis protein SpsF